MSESELTTLPPADKLVAVPFANCIGVGVVTADHGDTLTVVCDEWSGGTLFSVPRKWPKEQVFGSMKDCYRFWLKRHDALRVEFVKRYGSERTR
jgi:hypothetical protein